MNKWNKGSKDQIMEIRTKKKRKKKWECNNKEEKKGFLLSVLLQFSKKN